MKILIAVDGSEHTKKMLAYLAAHDEWRASPQSYTVLHTVLAVPPRAAAYIDGASVKDYYAAEAQKVFKPIKSFLSKAGIEADYMHKVGHPANEIAATATKGKYDLVMMGTHGHSALNNLIMGSVVTKVLALCTAPVLLVR